MKLKSLFVLAALAAMGLLIGSCARLKPIDQKGTETASKLTFDQRVDELVSQMTLEEKADMLGGTGFDTKPLARLGIPSMKMTDGPVGVRTGGDKASAFPSGVSMAATWDTSLIYKVGKAIAQETKARGKNVILGPCMNIHRVPMGGRNFESFGEDPYLAARMAVSYIHGVQNEKVVATVKHFAVNNQEWERNTINVRVDERTLHEIYFPAFKAAVQEGGVWSIMGAYNRINGPYCCASPYLLDEMAKNLWGFRGFIMSDWGAVHDTIPTLNAGLDLEMPTGLNLNKDAVVDAVKSGAVKETVIDDKVRRMIRAMMAMGFFAPDTTDKGAMNTPEIRAVALKTAIESAVLLKNDGILPLDRKKIRSIAVIGPNSTVGRTGGGGSSYVEPLYAVSPLEGIQKIAGKSIEIRSAVGAMVNEKIEPIGAEFLAPPNDKAGEGLRAEYFSNDKFLGKPVLTRIDKQVNWRWNVGAPAPELPGDYFSARWTGSLVPKETGLYSLVIGSDDGSRLYVDGKLLVDNWSKHGILYREGQIELAAGKAYPIILEMYEDVGDADMVLGWELMPRNPLNDAIEAARRTDVAVIFAGVTNQYESEGLDRNGLRLPAGQDEIIREIVKVNPNTVVVLNAGAALLMDPWLNDVRAVAHVWFPGEEGGNAIAELLFGDANFSGKLPTTFVKRWEDSPAFANYPGKDGAVDYAEGVFVGYRYFDTKSVEPLFPFGYGLSYTQFKYDDLVVTLSSGDKKGFTATCTIQNVGSRSGAEVAQLYLGDVESSVPRPTKELKGFSRVELAPGEKKTVTFSVDEAALSFYDTATHGWKAEPGLFKVSVGSSSRDIRLEGKFELK